MSAWFRSKFPHLTAGALASSAVVNAIVDYYQYDLQVLFSTDHINPLCPKRIRDYNAQIEKMVMSSPASAEAVMSFYGAMNLSIV